MSNCKSDILDENEKTFKVSAKAQNPLSVRLEAEKEKEQILNENILKNKDLQCKPVAAYLEPFKKAYDEQKQKQKDTTKALVKERNVNPMAMRPEGIHVTLTATREEIKKMKEKLGF